MAVIKQIDRQDFQALGIPTQTEFRYQGTEYRVEFSEPEEIRMAYFIRSVKIYQGKRLLKSGDIQDPEYLKLTTPDCRFVFIPFRGNHEIIDLHTENSLSLDAGWLIGNHFDSSSRYLLVVTFDEIRLMDLLQNKLLLNVHDRQAFIGQAHFGPDSLIWRIKKEDNRCILKRVDPVRLIESIEDIPSPFEFFNIDSAKYEKLLKLNKHCLWNKNSGGMMHTSLLNNWQFIDTDLGSVYQSPIPVSDVRYSDNHRTETCDVESCYVRIN